METKIILGAGLYGLYAARKLALKTAGGGV